MNVTLATLVYRGLVPGGDTLAISLVDTSGQTSGPAFVPIDVLPLIIPARAPAPVLTLSGGTLTLDTKNLDGITLDVHDRQTGAGAATLILIDTTLGPNTLLEVASANPDAPAPRVAIAGQTTLESAAVFNAGPALITLAEGSILINHGSLTFTDSSAHLAGAGLLQNEGIIAVSGQREARARTSTSRSPGRA